MNSQKAVAKRFTTICPPKSRVPHHIPLMYKYSPINPRKGEMSAKNCVPPRLTIFQHLRAKI